MKGDSKVIKQLNILLTEELTAADQYLVHSQMYHNWGYEALYTRIEHERQEEITHAVKLIERILFLEGTPDVASRSKLNVGKDVEAMIKSDLDLEYRVGKALREAMAVCEKAHDYVTRDILLTLLDDTERDHTHWLEQQLNIIKNIGLQNYLQSKL